MDHLLEAAFQFVFDFVLVGTGKLVIILLSLGQWRCESIFGNEGQIHGAAGGLSFVRDGRRVITTTGMTIVGFFFYFALIALLVIWASRS